MNFLLDTANKVTISLLAVLIVWSLVSCASTQSIKNAPITSGFERTFNKEMPLVLHLLRKSLAEENFTIADDSASSETTHIIIAETSVSAFSAGEVVRIVATQSENNTTSLWIYPERKAEINSNAIGDYSPMLFLRIEKSLPVADSLYAIPISQIELNKTPVFQPKVEQMPFWVWGEGGLGVMTSPWAMYADLAGGVAIERLILTGNYMSQGLQGDRWGYSSIENTSVLIGHVFLWHPGILAYVAVGVSGYKYESYRGHPSLQNIPYYAINVSGMGGSFELSVKSSLWGIGAGVTLLGNLNDRYSYAALKIAIQLGWMPHKDVFR